jgi:rare lipoprotein A (peptidoglycan hydrolase)
MSQLTTPFAATLVVASIMLMASSAAANTGPEPGQGYVRNFEEHMRGTPCEEKFFNHPQLDEVEQENLVAIESFESDASYFGNQFHNRNDMQSGNKLHECDATVVAFNSLPQGTILRATNPVTGRVLLLVIQDTGSEIVSRRPDLARGALEFLGGDLPAETIGKLEDIIFEVVVPTTDLATNE